MQANPKLRGVVLGQHGLINWADDRVCCDLTLSLVEKAAVYIESKDKGEKTFGGPEYKALAEAERAEIPLGLRPWLRGRVSQGKRFMATVQSHPPILRFVNSHDAACLAELGAPSPDHWCPDHFLRTKIKPLYVDWDPQNESVDALKQKLSAGLEQYRKDYAAYYETCRRPDSPPMRDPNPTVILIPGIGAPVGSHCQPGCDDDLRNETT